MNFKILTLFPEVFPGPFNQSIMGKALKKKLYTIKTFDIREFSTSKSKTVDDKPYGGGGGMVIKPDVLQKAFNFVKKDLGKKFLPIFLTPSGKKLDNEVIKRINEFNNIIIICGKYEGIDARFVEHNNIEEISIGDYVLSGGEIASFILIDACVRLIPEVLGNKNSLNSESFQNHLIEHPHFTKPQDWLGKKVPDVLLNGDHKKISDWRLKESIEKTKKVRPDLYKIYKKKIKGDK
jgi:tRNA (guanine37-N1)-methyltransferase